jgi:hypothetical protein
MNIEIARIEMRYPARVPVSEILIEIAVYLVIAVLMIHLIP